MDRSVLIRTAQQSDVAALASLAVETYCAAFGHTFEPADLAAHLERHLSPDRIARMIERDVVLLAEVEGRLVGYVQFGAMEYGSGWEGNQELRRLYVDPAFQNAGVGTALMQAALSHPDMRDAANIYLDVWEHNHGAQRFYQRFGFAVIGTRKFEVQSGAETSLDLIMVRRAIQTGEREDL